MIKLEKSGNATAKKTTTAKANVISMRFATNAKGTFRFNGMACHHLNNVPKIEYFYCEEQNAIVVKPYGGTGTSYALHKRGGSANVSVMNVVAERSGKDPSGLHLIGTAHNGQLTFPIDSLIAMELPRGQRVHSKVSKPRNKTFHYKAIAKNQHVSGIVKSINEKCAMKKIPALVHDKKVNILSCNIRKTRTDSLV
jgi:hypothetical protein